ncbi:DUF4286 family protein [Algoriphagus sanaruensis]|uniref:DUF4286 domain-containing protein n=1 Tax=Algoriphagus sanaruensis TaxID=1727163 RepID=A0A142EJT0_9BACT|nr:DUF4286 family protein [Algoriphagus sanaruensis]AMQ55385.1 hypothetical protein AO498_03180 [Algoriphagus sanaruensis]
MILYNITINVTPDIEQDFISWMKAVHIPEVLQSGMFVEHKFYKLLHESEDGSINYSIQFFAESMEKMMEYEQNHAPALRTKTRDRYQDRAVSFRSLLETV